VRLFDVFLFNNELDMLEVRLTELYDVVDYFVIGNTSVYCLLHLALNYIICYMMC
jgi:hypothetical protein